MANILALDQSSRISGFAVFTDGKLTEYGTFTMDDSSIPVRLVKIRNKVIELVEKYNIDKILLEDIQMQQQVNNVTTYKVLAQVLGVLEELCAEKGLPHEVIHSQTWKSALDIKGRDRATQKRNAQQYVLDTYGVKPAQDAADAICVGACYHKNTKAAWE